MLHAERLFVLKRLFSDGMKILSGEDVRSIRILFPPYRISMENLFSGGEKKFSFSADGPLNSFDFDESRKLCSFNYAVLSRQVIISAERNGRTEATRELTTCSWTSFCWWFRFWRWQSPIIWSRSRFGETAPKGRVSRSISLEESRSKLFSRFRQRRRKKGRFRERSGRWKSCRPEIGD